MQRAGVWWRHWNSNCWIGKKILRLRNFTSSQGCIPVGKEWLWKYYFCCSCRLNACVETAEVAKPIELFGMWTRAFLRGHCVGRVLVSLQGYCCFCRKGFNRIWGCRTLVRCLHLLNHPHPHTFTLSSGVARIWFEESTNRGADTETPKASIGWRLENGEKLSPPRPTRESG